jgi:hypothetical protein
MKGLNEMKDLIIKSLLTTFTTDQSLPEDLDESTLFEHFANFCVFSKEYSEEFDLSDLHTGSAGDIALDGIAILVNGSFINSTEEIDDLAKRNNYIQADFIFVQAKSSKSFDGANISNFLFGVRDIFNFDSNLPKNEKVKHKISLIKYIYTERASFLKYDNPKLKMYYVCTGRWQEDTYLRTKIDNEIKLLDDLGFFGDVNFVPVDSANLQNLYNYAQNGISQIVDFSSKITLPEISGVKEAYLGILPVTELLNLLTHEGTLFRGLFFDNVRDFQGDNEVNIEIQETIESDDRDLFVLLNNGVTIVAEKIHSTGNKFRIEGFQVVNGCQTSHVLYNNRQLLNEKMHVPIRLIVSEDDEVKNKIIKATNRQTPVKNENFISITDFQKQLERYYGAQQPDYKLYYERRSQQYRSMSGIEKIRIVTISTQIRAFASMFLDKPHLAGRYYGNLLEAVSNEIFLEGHKPIAYYISAYTNYKLDSFIRKRQIDEKYRPFKYILLMALRIKLGDKNMHSKMESNKFEKYCEGIQESVWDDSRILHALEDIFVMLDNKLGGNYDRASAKTSRLVTSVKDALM